MTTTTTRKYAVGDLVYSYDPGSRCSHCDAEMTGPIGVVEEHGIYDSYIVTLIDRDFDDGYGTSTTRLVCSRDELSSADPYDVGGVIHASPEAIAAAVDAGWLPPSSEFYGCEFRTGL